LLATNISLLGWLANNYQDAERLLLNIAIVIVVFITIIVVFINKKIIKDIKSLEDL